MAPLALVGRADECARVDGVLAMARTGSSGVLAIVGDPGVGKTALLDHAAQVAGGFRVVRAVGAEWETDLAYAGLQQLCAPLLGGLGALPAPQRMALEAAFGLRTVDGAPPDPLLVGLGTLNLLSEAAAEGPLLCVVDDVQWLDQASERALAIVARRLDADPVALLLAGRELGEVTRGSTREELRLPGLADADARALLARVLPVWTDPRLVDRIVAETHGNPLALLELTRGRSPAELAGDFGLLDVARLPERIERSFQRRLAKLPAGTRLLLLLAAAEPTGNSALLARACRAMSVPDTAVPAAVDAGLLSVGTQVLFSHPLVRSAVYRAASGADRREAHRVLAEATDVAADADRRAWHRGRAATGPDDGVASELAESAGQARKRGGVAAAAAFLQRAFELTESQDRRTERALAAVEAWHDAGGLDRAMDLLDALRHGPLQPAEQARTEWLRGRVIATRSDGSGGAEQIFRAARLLGPLDRHLARACYVDVMYATIRNPATEDRQQMGRALAALPIPDRPDGTDLLLHGCGRLISEGFPQGTDDMIRAIEVLAAAPPGEPDNYHVLVMAGTFAHNCWHEEEYDILSARLVALARTVGALGELPDALTLRACFCLACGDLSGAAAALDESDAIREIAGQRHSIESAWLAALRDTESVALAAIDRLVSECIELDKAPEPVETADYYRAVLYNGLGRHTDALAAVRRSSAAHPDGGYGNAFIELVEAAARCGEFEEAQAALTGLRLRLQMGGGRDYPLGLAARGAALLESGDAAEALYQEAVERLGRTRMRLPLARAHLLYGEWLRRERRRREAREQLRTAHEMFETMGARSFAERARGELAATGMTAHSRQRATLDELTPQEARIARMVADGLSNPEIAGRLYISKGTVDYHLNKVFRKLSVRSRVQLARTLTTGE